MTKEIVDCPEVFSLQKLSRLDPPHGVPINMGVKASGTLLFTKQVPLDIEGRSVGKDDIKVQTRQILENLTAMVKAAGATMTDVVSITWYTTDIEAFYSSASSRVRKEFLLEPYPTSVVVEISKLAMPEWLVEVHATAVVPD